MRSSSKRELTQETRIKIRMLEEGYDRNDIAYVLGVSPEYISYLVNGKRRNEYYQNLIANVLHRKPEELFDER